MSKKNTNIQKLVVNTIREDSHLFAGRLCEVLNVVNNLIEQHGEQAYVSYELEEDPWSDTPELRYTISYQRRETKLERDVRVAREKAIEENRIKNERAEYDRLRKKFGDAV